MILARSMTLSKKGIEGLKDVLGKDHGDDDLKDVEHEEDEDKVTLHLQPAPSLTQCLFEVS